MPAPAIQVDHLWKKFRRGELEDSLRDLLPNLLKRAVGFQPRKRVDEFWAIKDVSFEVQPGQSLGIIGPNGAGKSTMLKLLSRIIRPTRGQYHVHGRLSALIEVGAGFHQDLTGRENIYLNGAILGMKRREIKAKEEAIVEFAGVRDFMGTPVKRYSSGMKARLGFAVAAHMDPEILLVDEVLSVGDARFRDKCVRHMHQLLNSGITVVFISHILDQVRSLCPNTLVLNQGQAMFHGPTGEAIRTYLDVLDAANTRPGEHVHGPAELRNIRFADADGREILEWDAGEPGIVEMDLVMHEAFETPSVQINFNTIGGQYLATADVRAMGFEIPARSGTYHLRYVFDPMPLNAGDYMLEFKIYGGPEFECQWVAPQPRTLSIRGADIGGVLQCKGAWEVAEAAPALMAKAS